MKIAERRVNHRLDKKLFYEYLKPFANKALPILIDMPINKNEFYYRLIFDWTSHKPNGDFNPIMTAQFIDIRESGFHIYITRDLNWNCIDEGTITDYKLYKFLDKWITGTLNENEGDNEE